MLNLRRCSKCHRIKFITSFYTSPKSKGGISAHCKVCHQVYANGCTRSVSHLNLLYNTSIKDAGERKIEHTIRPDDVPLPDTCCYFNVNLDYRPVFLIMARTWNTATITRVDLTKGYVPGNVQVISDLASRMKQEATIEQLVAFARGVLRIHAGEDEEENQEEKSGIR